MNLCGQADSHQLYQEEELGSSDIQHQGFHQHSGASIQGPHLEKNQESLAKTYAAAELPIPGNGWGYSYINVRHLMKK